MASPAGYNMTSAMLIIISLMFTALWLLPSSHAYRMPEGSFEYPEIHELLSESDMPIYRFEDRMPSHFHTYQFGATFFTTNTSVHNLQQVDFFYDYPGRRIRWAWPNEVVLRVEADQMEYTIIQIDKGRKVCFGRPLTNYTVQRPHFLTHSFLTTLTQQGALDHRIYRHKACHCVRQEYGHGMAFRRDWSKHAPGLQQQLVQSVLDVCVHPRYVRAEYKNHVHEWLEVKNYGGVLEMPKDLWDIPQNNVTFVGQHDCFSYDDLPASPMRAARWAMLELSEQVFKMVFEGLRFVRI